MTAQKPLPLGWEFQDGQQPKIPFLWAGSSGRDGGWAAPSSGPGAVVQWLRSPYLWLSSTEGRYKAFSTCGSHLCVVCFLYATALGVYLSSAMTHYSQASMIASVLYTVVTPMLNPFIYILKNKDVMGALGRLLSRAASCL
ncbi:Olfactory receptor 7D4 [Heterocephalus glaber]|uniref:Olfactory receptor 7D4 n=1 Tax=Heterocephalus glaber TaxID=10181 RepID=G5B1Q8_HETGA|nr:Olfactory receptor 7D4 [Heterocephalus glaber]